MKSLIVFSLILNVSRALSFDGCGDYVVKGILRENMNQTYRVDYILNEGTQGQIILKINNDKDFLSVYNTLNLPSILKVEIMRPFDGTIGKIEKILEIWPRMSDPLSIEQETRKLTSKNCL